MKKSRNVEVESKFLDKLIKEIPLKTSIKVIIQMQFLSILTDLGLRESKSWGSDEEEMYNNLMKQASITCKYILEELEMYNVDINKTKDE